MVRLIFSILVFVVLAVFIALNAQYTTTINFFSYVVEEVSVAAVVTITMAVGVLYSFTLYLSNYFAKSRAGRIKSQKLKNKAKAGELAEKAKELKQAPSSELAEKPKRVWFWSRKGAKPSAPPGGESAASDSESAPARAAGRATRPRRSGR